MGPTFDLFPAKPLTQCEKVYGFIKGRGRVKTHELNLFGIQECINSVQSRARELKAQGLIWRMRADIQMVAFGNIKEEVWSTFEADKEMS